MIEYWGYLDNARVVELAYTHDSKSCAARLVGSTPTSGTTLESLTVYFAMLK